MSGSWLDDLQPASWRGLPFFVQRGEIRAGRRKAVHEYPFRDGVWVEDLGKKGRIFGFSAFLVGDDCYRQLQSMIQAAEQDGPGTLIHPILGSVTADCTGFSSNTEVERGRAVFLEFEFTQGVPTVLYPGASVSTQDQVGLAANDLDQAAADDFAQDFTEAAGGLVAGLSGTVTSVIAAGALAASVALSVVDVVDTLANGVLAVVGDARAIAGAVIGLVGPLGRYAGGRASSPLPGITTAPQALAAQTVSAAAVSAAAVTARAAAATTSIPTAAALQPPLLALTEALRAAAPDPADQVRLLLPLATASPPVLVAGPVSPPAPLAQAQQAAATAAGALCRRAALSSLARAAASYAPVSASDAAALLATLIPAYDAEIVAAADAGDQASYLALLALQAAVATDITQRGALLPGLIQVTTAASLPALALAYRLYGDTTRADQLIGFADPIDPTFMPVSFQALAS